MSIVRKTITGENYLRKTITGGDKNSASSVQIYEKQVGSDGATSNTVYTLNNPYITESDTLMVFVNGLKCENVTTRSPSASDEYSETDGNTVTMGGSLGNDDVVEFIVAGAYILNDSDISKIGGVVWSIISTNTTALSKRGYLIDASSGNVELTLPLSPSEGDSVGVCDFYNKATTNTITINRNGNNIDSVAANDVLDTDGIAFILIYSDATVGWKRVSEAGTGLNTTLKKVGVL